MHTCTHVYLVRHGEKISEFGDPGLTPKGQMQARATGAYLSQFSIQSVSASPLRRAQETALYIGKATQCEIMTDDRLRERANWGDKKEQTFLEFKKMWVHATHDRDWRPPTGDSSHDAGLRMVKAIVELAHKQYERAVLVTHGGVICDLVRNLFSSEKLDSMLPNFSLVTDDLAHECSITELVVDRDLQILDISQLLNVSHLSKELL